MSPSTILLAFVSLLSTSLAALPDAVPLPVTEPSTGGVGAKKFSTTLDCAKVIAFSAVGARLGEKSGSSTKLIFSRDLIDRGIGWSSEPGVFTCHCPGLYQFSFAGAGTNLKLALKKKTSTKESWTTVVATSPATGANVALLDMEIGDGVSVWKEEGELQQDNEISPVSSFSGFRIAKK